MTESDNLRTMVELAETPAVMKLMLDLESLAAHVDRRDHDDEREAFHCFIEALCVASAKIGEGHDWYGEFVHDVRQAVVTLTDEVPQLIEATEHSARWN